MTSLVIGGIVKEAGLRVDNTKFGFRKAVQWLKRMKVQEGWLICMEHTGVYNQPLWEYLTDLFLASDHYTLIRGQKAY